MEVTGKLIGILPIQTGEGKNGVWKKQDIILEIDGDSSFPKKLCVSFWNDRIISDLMEGSMLKVFFEIDSREYNDKWYTNLRGVKVEEVSEMGLMNATPKNTKKDFSFDVQEKETDFPTFESDLPFDNEVMPF